MLEAKFIKDNAHRRHVMIEHLATNIANFYAKKQFIPESQLKSFKFLEDIVRIYVAAEQ